MISNRKILLLISTLFIFCFCHAQSDSTTIEKENEIKSIEYKKIEFTLVSLQPKDSIFFKNLNNIIICDLDTMYKNCSTIQWKMIEIDIKHDNASIYIIHAEESDRPVEECDGFIKFNEYTYFINGDIDRLFTPTKKKKKFSYVNIIYTYDPPIWELKYNILNKKLEVIKKDFFYNIKH